MMVGYFLAIDVASEHLNNYLLYIKERGFNNCRKFDTGFLFVFKACLVLDKGA